MKVEVSDKNEYEELLTPKQYEEHLSESIWFKTSYLLHTRIQFNTSTSYGSVNLESNMQ